ncbi:MULTISPECIES: prenyltransferase/squalene oxidase repeat-containing protein [Burkholderia]|uniref:prenyltransferase/squalene oxidase repeat-containing protein n=1 Tax=Burkholderia TaxID=32008 RepID=UPI000841CD75|nr:MULTISPECIES: prenyltransferase/squalene oxidase repeat-containing protein [unclassified Burkholderia]AOK31543.1 hypothetical protein AQ611_18450 [Burkholderia sp. Bp7605]
MQSDVLKFIELRLKDGEYGGYFPVTDCEGKIVVSTDKRLIDQVNAAILYIEQGDEANAEFAVAALDKLYRPEQGGFSELTDRYWNPQAVGGARTLHVQLNAARALLLYAEKFGKPIYSTRAFDLLEKVRTLAQQGELAGIYSADWTVALDDAGGLDLEISATCLAATLKKLGIDRGLDVLSALVDRLKQRLEAGAGKWQSRAFLSCEVRAKTAIALAKWASANADGALAGKVRSFLKATIDLYRDTRYGGFWDRVNASEQVKVDWQVSYVKNESPFPIKRTMDAALLLKAVRESGHADAAVEDELIHAVAHFRDAQSGGFFLGMGYFWSTPEDPTVPFARQFWAAPRQPGVFTIGNLSYLPLHVKTLETQIVCAQVAQALPEAPRAGAADIDSELIDHALNGNFRDPHTGAVPTLPVNVDKYLNWLDRARPSKSLPYGLTAEISPLGFRADRTWQVFSALHVLSDLRALDMPIAAAEDLVRSIRNCQNADGGFSEQPGQLSDVFATYCATVSLRLLNSEPLNPQACIDYVNRCQNPDGGFGNVPGLRSDIWHTNLAVLSLHALEAEPADKNGVFAFALACRCADGGFSNMPGLPPDTFSTYRAVSTLGALGKRLAHATATVDWLRALQDPSGPFLYRPGRARSLVGTYMAIASLYLLDSEPKFPEEVKQWVALHQKEDGGFGPLGTTSATTDESFTCIQTLLILQRSLTPYWVAVVN